MLKRCEVARRRKPVQLCVGNLSGQCFRKLRWHSRIVWRGNPRHRGDRHRSLAPERLLALADIEGVQLYSLQVGAPLPARRKGAAAVDLSDRLRSFADTAAAIQALDLVVSVDTAVAHLAGESRSG